MERPYACKEIGCTKTYAKLKQLNHHKRGVHVRKVNGRNVRYLASEMLARARKRAQRKGGVVTITLKWVVDILKLGRCQGSIPPLQLEVRNASGPFSPSLDRIDSRNPSYTPENTRVVCWCINSMRNNFTDSVIETASYSLINFIRRRRNSM
jgi:hypothetical protein